MSGWLVAAVAHLVWAVHASPRVVDDAYISARYAAHLAAGHGLVYNAGAPPIEGYTNLTWTVLLASAHVLGLDIHTFMAWAGAAFGVLLLGACTGLTAHLVGRPAPAALLPALVLALSPHVAIASTNGLESSMFAAGVVAATWAALAATGRARWAAGLALGALAAVRPEGLAVALGAAGFLGLTRWRREGATASAPLALGAAGPILALHAWRWLTYGELVPNTAHAKAGIAIDALLRMNVGYLGQDGAYWFVAGGALLAAALLPPWRAGRWLVALLALGLVAVSFSVYMWMPSGRLLLPSLALAACLVAARAAEGPRLVRGAVWAALLAAAVAEGMPSAWREAEAHAARHTVPADNGSAVAARHLAAHLPAGSVVTTRDAGVFAYWLGTDVHVVETHSRALTLPHPEGRDIDVLASAPVAPAAMITTFARRERDTWYYDNDRRLFRRATRAAEYRYMGRVEQHYHRFVDIWVRADLAVPDLPGSVVVGRAGQAFAPPHAPDVNSAPGAATLRSSVEEP